MRPPGSITNMGCCSSSSSSSEPSCSCCCCSAAESWPWLSSAPPKTPGYLALRVQSISMVLPLSSAAAGGCCCCSAASPSSRSAPLDMWAEAAHHTALHERERGRVAGTGVGRRCGAAARKAAGMPVRDSPGGGAPAHLGRAPHGPPGGVLLSRCGCVGLPSARRVCHGVPPVWGSDAGITRRETVGQRPLRPRPQQNGPREPTACSRPWRTVARRLPKGQPVAAGGRAAWLGRPAAASTPLRGPNAEWCVSQRAPVRVALRMVVPADGWLLPLAQTAGRHPRCAKDCPCCTGHSGAATSGTHRRGRPAHRRCAKLPPATAHAAHSAGARGSQREGLAWHVVVLSPVTDAAAA